MNGGFGGGGTYLGHPINNNIGAPGTGEEYCWSSTLNTFGDFPTEFAANNFVVLTSPPSASAGNSMNWNGIYAPEQSFINLVGCPLNGDWSITVRDNLGIDDGYIFEWSILFDPIINIKSAAFIMNEMYKREMLKGTKSKDESMLRRYFGGNFKKYSDDIDKKVMSIVKPNLYRY